MYLEDAIDMDGAHLIRLPPRIIEHEYTFKDVILYALGVGATDLKYTYEKDLSVLPSMAVVLSYPGYWQQEPQYEIDWQKNLQAEQSVLFHRPFPVEGKVRGEMVIDAIVDKGEAKGALLRAIRKIYDDATNDLLATVRQTSFLRGDGGCGNHGGELDPPQIMPERDPDDVLPLKVPENLAHIYRLSGDYNPLHIDPEIAQGAGLDQPVLHGLAVYGMATRAILKVCLEDQTERLSRMDCRFTSPVYPGDALEMDLWRENSGQALFRIRVPKRGVTAIDRGRADFRLS